MICMRVKVQRPEWYTRRTTSLWWFEMVRPEQIVLLQLYNAEGEDMVYSIWKHIDVLIVW